MSSSDIAMQTGDKESAIGGPDAISSVAKQHDRTSGHRRDEVANCDSGDTRSIGESKGAIIAPKTKSRQGDTLRSDDDDTAKADNKEEKATAEALKLGLEDKRGRKEDKGGSNDDETAKAHII